MTYRDDHDAALARAEALAAELARERAASAAKDRELAQTRRALAKKDGPYVRGEPVALPREAPSLVVRIAILAGFLILIAILTGRDTPPEASNPSNDPDVLVLANVWCEIGASAPGAEVFASLEVNGQQLHEESLGVAPLRVRRHAILGRKLEARLGTHSSGRVAVPSGSCDVILTLR